MLLPGLRRLVLLTLAVAVLVPRIAFGEAPPVLERIERTDRKSVV